MLKSMKADQVKELLGVPWYTPLLLSVASLATACGLFSPDIPRVELSSAPVKVPAAYETKLASFIWAGDQLNSNSEYSSIANESICPALEGREVVITSTLRRAFADGILGFAILEVQHDALVLDAKRIVPGEPSQEDNEQGTFDISSLTTELEERFEADERLHVACGFKPRERRLLVVAAKEVPYGRLQPVLNSLYKASVANYFFWVNSDTLHPMPNKLLPKTQTSVVERVEDDEQESPSRSGRKPTREELIEKLSAPKLLGFMHPATNDIHGRALFVVFDDDGQLELHLESGETMGTSVAELEKTARAFTAANPRPTEDDAVVGCAVITPQWATSWAELVHVVYQLQASGSERTTLNPGVILGNERPAISVERPPEEAPTVVPFGATIATLHPSWFSLFPPSSCEKEWFPDGRGECNPSCRSAVEDIFGNDDTLDNLDKALSNTSGIAVSRRSSRTTEAAPAEEAAPE
jgi:hypothetical protein